MSLSVLPGARSSVYILCPLLGRASPSGSACTTPPYGSSSLVFCCPGAWEVHQTQESNLSTALFPLYCDISLSGQSDKSHMASPHERTAAASSRCCSADCPWSGKLGFKNSIRVIVKEFTMSWKGRCGFKDVSVDLLWWIKMKYMMCMFFISKCFQIVWLGSNLRCEWIKSVSCSLLFYSRAVHICTKAEFSRVEKINWAFTE